MNHSIQECKYTCRIGYLGKYRKQTDKSSQDRQQDRFDLFRIDTCIRSNVDLLALACLLYGMYLVCVLHTDNCT